MDLNQLADDMINQDENLEMKLVEITDNLEGTGEASGNLSWNDHYEKLVSRPTGKPIRVFECGICGLNFERKFHLVRHVSQHIDTDRERPFSCNICNQRFRQLSTLQQHSAIHSNERPFACEICQKAFNRASTLISHKKTHSDIKPYVCPTCKRGFFQKGNLKNHIYSHTNERPYKCEFCDRGFNQMSNLVCHRRKIHAAKMSEADVQKCKFCQAQFSRKQDLREHERSEHPTPTKKITNRQRVQRVKPKAAPPAERTELYIERIRTKAMISVVHRNEIPFVIVDFLDRKNVAMRAFPCQDGSFLRVANKEDMAEINGNAMPIVAHVTEVLSDDKVTTTFMITPPQNCANEQEDRKLEDASINEMIDLNTNNLAVYNSADWYEIPIGDMESSLLLASPNIKAVSIEDISVKLEHEDDVVFQDL